MIAKPLYNALEIEQLTMGYPKGGNDPGFLRKEISFIAETGEMVALIGPNGSGKSTLLKTMAGFIPALEGSIKWQGKAISSFSPQELARLISFVSTENLNLPHMQVADLVAYGRFPFTGWLGRLRTEDREKVRESLRKTGLSAFAHREVTTLSDGERQRALIARALAQDTPFILLDEPTAFLDVSAKYEIFQLLGQLASEDEKTIILSTHDLGIALKEADKLWMLSPSGIFQGAPEDAVLQNWLNHLFTDDRMGFDKTSGNFYFKTTPVGKVVVSGTGEPFEWTCRALVRAGYSVEFRNGDITTPQAPENRDPDSLPWEEGHSRSTSGERETSLPVPEIGVSGGETPETLLWHLTTSLETVSFRSIHELISHLRKINHRSRLLTDH